MLTSLPLLFKSRTFALSASRNLYLKAALGLSGPDPAFGKYTLISMNSPWSVSTILYTKGDAFDCQMIASMTYEYQLIQAFPSCHNHKQVLSMLMLHSQRSMAGCLLSRGHIQRWLHSTVSVQHCKIVETAEACTVGIHFAMSTAVTLCCAQ